jgi:hypothetical protein
MNDRNLKQVPFGGVYPWEGRMKIEGKRGV